MIKDKIIKYLREHLLLQSFLIALFMIGGLLIIVFLVMAFISYLVKVFGGGAVFSTTLLFFAFFWCWSEVYKRVKGEVEIEWKK